MPKLTNEIIAAAILGFEEQKKHIDAQIAELREMLDGGGKATPAATSEAPTGKRRNFSATARRRMKEAQQRRWARIRGEASSPGPVAPEPSKPKRRLSKAGKAAIVAALKKRWAAKKAVAQPKPAKKATAKKTSA